MFVGADAHIGPLKSCGFASDFHKTGQFRPYGVKWKIKTDSPENHHKTGVFLRVDVGIDPYGAKQKIVAFCEVFCRGGQPCPPSKLVEFSWLFVGADAHIGPLKSCGFASDFHKTGQFRPYGVKWKIKTDSPENHHKTGVSGGSM